MFVSMLSEILNRGVEQLLGRASGLLNLRLVIQPLVAIILAVRAGLKDARAGNPAFLWTILTNSAGRQLLIQSGWKDISKVFVIAIVLDAVYQLIEFRAFYIIQALIVAAVVALVPYILFRGIVTRLTRRFYRSQVGPTDKSAAGKTK
jgi:hypothetical protein